MDHSLTPAWLLVTKGPFWRVSGIPTFGPTFMLPICVSESNPCMTPQWSMLAPFEW